MELLSDFRWTWIAALGAIAAGTLLGFVARRLVLKPALALASRTTSLIDDVVVTSLRRPLPLWTTLGGIYVATRIVEVPERWTPLLDKLIVSAWIVSVTFWLANLSVQLLLISTADQKASPRVTGIMLIGVRSGVMLLGAAALLGTLGISIAPILTTFGIGGVAVALGLQDTLSNLFAGVHIALAANIRVGDFIELESGQTGYVEDIRWRATRVRTLNNNFILIPNARLSHAIVTNHNLPTKELAIRVQMGVHYASDLDRVERIAREVATHVMKTVPGGVPDFVPLVRFDAFGQSSIDFIVVMRAQEFSAAALVKHEFIKAASRRFAAEGIVIPYPVRAINLEQERAASTPKGADAADGPAASPFAGKAPAPPKVP